MKGTWSCEELGKDGTRKESSMLYFTAISVLRVDGFTTSSSSQDTQNLLGNTHSLIQQNISFYFLLGHCDRLYCCSLIVIGSLREAIHPSSMEHRVVLWLTRGKHSYVWCIDISHIPIGLSIYQSSIYIIIIIIIINQQK